MNWTPLHINTLIPLMPKIITDNFTTFKLYMDVFYDENSGIIIKPVNTTGRIKGATGEFVNVIVDNLTVKNQWTNRYENSTTADYDFWQAYTELAVSPRDPCTYEIDTSVWTFPFEDPSYKVINVNKPYYKITNANPIFLANENISQVVGIIFDVSIIGNENFEIMMDPCAGTTYIVDASQAGLAYMEFITTEFDASWGSTWAQYKYGIDEPSAGEVTIAVFDAAISDIWTKFGYVDTSLGDIWIELDNIDTSFGLYETKLNLDTSFGLYSTSVNLDTSFGLYETKLNLDTSFGTVWTKFEYVDTSLNGIWTELDNIDNSFGNISLDNLIDTSVAGKANNDLLQYNTDTSTWDSVTPVEVSAYYTLTVDIDASFADVWTELDNIDTSFGTVWTKFGNVDISLNGIWTELDASTILVTNQADNRIITSTTTAEVLNAEVSLYFDGTVLSVGVENYTTGNPRIVIGGSRALATNFHAFADEESVNPDTAVGFNSFESQKTVTGSNDLDHYAGFQFSPIYNNSGTITRLTGYQFLPDVNAGTATYVRGVEIRDPVAGSTINNLWGIYIESLSRGNITNYAITIGDSDVSQNLIHVGVTGDPIFGWDESADLFTFSKGLIIRDNVIMDAPTSTRTSPYYTASNSNVMSVGSTIANGIGVLEIVGSESGSSTVGLLCITNALSTDTYKRIAQMSAATDGHVNQGRLRWHLWDASSVANLVWDVKVSTHDWYTSDTGRLQLNDNELRPYTNDEINLGSASYRFVNTYINNVSIIGGASTNSLTIYNGPTDSSSAITRGYVDASFGLYETKTNLDSSFGLYETKTNLDSSLNAKANLNTIVDIKETTYVLVATDNNHVIDASDSWTLTFPDDLDTGFQVTVVNAGIGTITLDASKLLTKNSFVTLTDQYAGASAVHKGSGVWYVWGDLT